MEKEEQIRKAAYELLLVQNPSGHSERWLWDRTCRIVRHVEAVLRLGEIQEIRAAIDVFALKTAAYLTDAGLPVYAQAKELSFSSALLELGRPELREFSIQVVQEKFSSLPSPETLDLVCRVIRESDNRFTKLTEARILSDARNLEDMGMIGIIQDIRRCLLQGKGVSAILESWRRKIDYRYWEARLKEDFHYEAVRRLARQRFAAAQECMQALEAEDLGKDFNRLIMETLPK